MQREALILLPGMMCDARMFAPQIEAFGDRFDVTVGTMTGRDSIEDLARSVLDEAGPEPFNLAGLSMGGIVAMAVAGLAPQRVRRLALLDTNHLADPPERRAIRDDQIQRVRSGRLAEVIIEEMKPNYLGPDQRGDPGLLELLRDMALDLGPDVFVEQSLALRDRPDQSPALEAYTGPALVLCGEHDTLCPPERHRQIAGLVTDANLVFVEGSGHISTLERPEAVNAAFGDWLTA